MIWNYVDSSYIVNGFNAYQVLMRNCGPMMILIKIWRVWSKIVLFFSHADFFLHQGHDCESWHLQEGPQPQRRLPRRTCVWEKEEKKNQLFSLPPAELCVLPAVWSGAEVKGKGLSEGADSSVSCLSALDFILLLLLLQHYPLLFGLSLPHLISHLEKHSYGCNPEPGKHLHHDTVLYPCQNPD